MYTKQEIYLKSSIKSPKNHYKSFVCVDVHKNEIISIIKSLCSDKTSGVDNMSIKILKSYVAHVNN